MRLILTKASRIGSIKSSTFLTILAFFQIVQIEITDSTILVLAFVQDKVEIGIVSLRTAFQNADELSFDLLIESSPLNQIMVDFNFLLPVIRNGPGEPLGKSGGYQVSSAARGP